jgi:hypothetical protein
MRHGLIAFLGLLAAFPGCERRLPWKRELTAATAVEFMLLDALVQQGVHKLQDIARDAGSTKDYANVADIYEHCDCPSAARWYNLGNARFLADQLPEAILAYCRGLRLDPNDAGIRANLDYARAKVSYHFGHRGHPEVDSWPSSLYRPSSFQVLVAAFVLYALACVLFTRWFVTWRQPLLSRSVVVLVLAAITGVYWLHLESERDRQKQYPLVLIRDAHVPLRKGNGPSYPVNPDLPILSRGMEARKMHERGGWLQIRFASGEIGWVEKTAVLVDEP